MGKFLNSKTISLVCAVLLVTILATPLASALTVENVKAWNSDYIRDIPAVAQGDVDGDGAVEIVTGGSYETLNNPTYAQLCVWSQ